MLVFVETFYSKPGGWLNRGGEWSPISINTLLSLQYSAPAQPLSQTRNNVSVRCFVRDLKLLTVTDYWVQRGAEGTELNLETVRKLQIWRGKMRPVTRGCSVQLFKMWALSQLQDCYSNVLSSRCHHLKTSFILQTGGGKKSSAAHRKSSTTFCYFSDRIEKVFNHIARSFSSTRHMDEEGCAISECFM